MALDFTEKRVVEIWKDYLPGRTGLVTEENESLEIIYPGRINDDPGADLRDAIIATGEGLLRGDVEIHLKSSNWREHGHDEDPTYNRVILHVVYRHDTEAGIVLQNGCKVPTLALEKYIDTPATGKIATIYPSTVRPLPCHRVIHGDNPTIIGDIIDEAGEQRFISKTNDFRVKIAQVGAGQALYQGMMMALGYSRNKEAMATLASVVPLQNLEAAVTEEMTNRECLLHFQSRLLGAAGLLPSQQATKQSSRDANKWVEELEKIWAAGDEKAQMSANDWHFFKVRPGNYPVRRITAMSYLLLRYGEKGLVSGLNNNIRETEVNEAGQKLEEALLVAADGYWSEYLDFGIRAGENAPALLGKERAGAIVINVLLPFMTAMGNAANEPETVEKALKIYRRYPAAAENTVERHMSKQLGIGRKMVKSARRQQGLIHIHKALCSQGRCCDCPVKQVSDRRGN